MGSVPNRVGKKKTSKRQNGIYKMNVVNECFAENQIVPTPRPDMLHTEPFYLYGLHCLLQFTAHAFAVFARYFAML